MKLASAISLGVLCTLLTGCEYLVDITNNGPNPVTITANPSPDDPPLPLEIGVGETETLLWVQGTTHFTTINAVDMTTFESDTLEDLQINNEHVKLEWDGTQLIDVTNAP